MAAVVCAKLGCTRERERHEGGCFWQGRWYCSNRCSHDAGDRSACLGWDCGCTNYAKKRRMLREHREQMRVMEMYIEDRDEYEDALDQEMGSLGFDLELDDGLGGLDEASDIEDPDALLAQQVQALRQELADREAFVTAVNGALDHSGMVREVERARMQLEDHRAQGRR